jgi:hypothetical protein
VVKRRSLGLVLGVLGVAIVACQVVAGIEPVEKEQRGGPGTDGGPDVLADGKVAPGPADPCKHKLPAPAPETDDDRNTEVAPFYLALRTLSLVKKEGDSYAGYDLDNVCTCEKRPNTAADGGSSCTPKAKDCDFDGGVDNNAALLFERLAPGGFSPDDDASNGINGGKRGLLLYISKYNGKPNDREIEVGAMLSHGILDGSGCGTSTGGDRSPPGWCGHDLWTYSTEFVRPGSKEPVFKGVGYVNNGELVFSSDGAIKMFFGGATLSFGSPVTAGKIAKNSQGFWTLAGLLTGRIPVTELLAATGNFDDPGGGTQGLCNSVFFTTVRTTLCDAVDINRTSAFDFKEGACDAISSTISFTAEQADVGEERTEPAEANPCAKENVPAATYTCP